MVTTIDKAIQDWLISTIALFAMMGFDFSSVQGWLIPLAGGLLKGAITWLIPNKKF